MMRMLKLNFFPEIDVLLLKPMLELCDLKVSMMQFFMSALAGQSIGENLSCLLEAGDHKGIPCPLSAKHAGMHRAQDMASYQKRDCQPRPCAHGQHIGTFSGGLFAKVIWGRHVARFAIRKTGHHPRECFVDSSGRRGRNPWSGPRMGDRATLLRKVNHGNDDAIQIQGFRKVPETVVNFCVYAIRGEVYKVL